MIKTWTSAYNVYRGLTLNASKCKLLSPTLEFFGQVFSADGTRPDPQRVVDLQNVATPTTVHEVRSLLGITNYSSQYIANFATITAPLRDLTKKDTPFRWTTEHINAFNTLKAALTSPPCMGYFDIRKEISVVVDASLSDYRPSFPKTRQMSTMPELLHTQAVHYRPSRPATPKLNAKPLLSSGRSNTFTCSYLDIASL